MKSDILSIGLTFKYQYMLRCDIYIKHNVMMLQNTLASHVIELLIKLSCTYGPVDKVH